MTVFVISIGDIMAALFFLFLASIMGKVYFDHWNEQRKCRHDSGVIETQACDAICKKCGKNLGFIGEWRAKHGMDN